MGMLGGGTGGLDGIWDSPMVANIAFHPSRVAPEYLGATSGRIRDGTFDVSGGDKVSYRLYVPDDIASVKLVVYFFHGNAEVCTAQDDMADMMHCNGAAVLSIDYRGYSWGTGTPSLAKLCGDAEHCFVSSQAVLSEAGIGDVKRVAQGRSIGATCAVHLASRFANKFHGLIVDSGLMSIKQLPMVQMMAPLLFGQNPGMFEMIKEPFDTPGKMATIACPVLVTHGDQDEIVPYAQAVQCHERAAAAQKKLVTFPGAGHNNVLAMFASDWVKEVQALLEQALAFSCEFPAGALVETHSLSAGDMNGLQGRIIGPQGDRFRVRLPEPQGEKALKAANLRLIPELGIEDFPIGCEVEAHSLSAAELNGLKGKVIGIKGPDRMVVLFPSVGEKALKPANLKNCCAPL